MQEVDRLGWAVTVPLRAGNHVLGVRVPSEDAAALVRELFADRYVPDATPPGNLSLWLAPPSTDGAQDLHRLYQTFTRSLRSRSVTRTLAALWHELDARDVRVDGTQLLVDATTLVDGASRAHLLNRNWRRFVVDDEKRWRRAGLHLVERRWVHLDPQQGTVHAPPVPEQLTEAALEDRIAALGVDHSADGEVRSGTWPIATWTVRPQERTLAQRAVGSAGAVLDLRGRAGADTVREMVGLSERLVQVPEGWSGLEELREALAQLSSDTAA